MSQLIDAHLQTAKLIPAVVCYLLDRPNRKVWLGKRIKVSHNLGHNIIAGFGGKVGDAPEIANETFEDALKRELFEEAGGVVAVEFQELGRLRYLYTNKPEWQMEVRAYLVTGWEGIPAENEFMVPMLFDVDALPTESMWEDNQDWVPQLLNGKKVDAVYLFGDDGKILERVFLESAPLSI